MKKILIIVLLTLLCFSCTNKVYHINPKPKPLSVLQPYIFPNGHRLVAFDDAVLIIDKSGNRIFNVYITSGETFVTDSTTFQHLKNGGGQ